MEFVPRPREPRSGKKVKFREEKDPEKRKSFGRKMWYFGKI